MVSRTILVVEDEPPVARYVGRVLSPTFDTVSARTVLEGVDALGRGGWAGVVIDIRLPDGSGLEVLRELRRRSPTLPALVLTADHEPDIINAAQRLRAEFVVKPDCAVNLRDFARRCAIAQTGEGRADRFRVALSGFAERFGLSPRESQILALAVDGVPRSRVASEIGVSENTIKTQVRSLLTKSGCSSLSDAVWRVRSELRESSAGMDAAPSS